MSQTGAAVTFLIFEVVGHLGGDVVLPSVSVSSGCPADEEKSAVSVTVSRVLTLHPRSKSSFQSAAVWLILALRRVSLQGLRFLVLRCPAASSFM